MNTRPNTAAIFTFILGVTIAIAGPSFAELIRGDIVVFGDGETLTATDLNTNFDVLATAAEDQIELMNACWGQPAIEISAGTELTPGLARRVIVQETIDLPIDTANSGDQSVLRWLACPDGSTLITGGCTHRNATRTDAPDPQFTVTESFQATGRDEWGCTATKPRANASQLQMRVLCVPEACAPPSSL